MTKKEEIGHLIMVVARQEVSDKVKARAIGTMLYDIPATKSGFISKTCVDKDGYRPRYSAMCAEHFHSRNEAGFRIINLVRNEPESKFWAFLDECTTVHYTTKQENNILCRIQNDPATRSLSWKDQYRLAGIKLVKDKGMAPRRKKSK